MIVAELGEAEMARGSAMFLLVCMCVGDVARLTVLSAVWSRAWYVQSPWEGDVADWCVRGSTAPHRLLYRWSMMQFSGERHGKRKLLDWEDDKWEGWRTRSHGSVGGGLVRP